MEHLHAHQLEAFGLKPLDDLSNDAPLHTIRLDGNKGALLQISHDSKNAARKKDEDKQWSAACSRSSKPETSLTRLCCICHSWRWGWPPRAPTPLHSQRIDYTAQVIVALRVIAETWLTFSQPHPQGKELYPWHCFYGPLGRDSKCSEVEVPQLSD